MGDGRRASVQGHRLGGVQVSWKLNKLVLTNSEDGRTVVLGDVVRVSHVVQKTVAVYDDDVDPTIRSVDPLSEVANGRVIKRLVNCELREWQNGLVVGVRFLPECRVTKIEYRHDEYSNFVKQPAVRKPYLLVCFWPTHKPVLVDPAYAHHHEFAGFNFEWRKYVPAHPDAEFRKEWYKQIEPCK